MEQHDSDFVRARITVNNGCAYNEPSQVDDYPAPLFEDVGRPQKVLRTKTIL